MSEEMIQFIHAFSGKENLEEYSKFDDVLSNVKRMTGRGVMYLLNSLVSMMSNDNFYMEFGTHAGSTLVGAAFQNDGKMCIGIDSFVGHNDNFQKYGNSVEDALNNAIGKFCSKNATYYNADGYSFLESQKDGSYSRKVKIYFYDGDHKKEDTKRGILEARHLLCDDAIVILDDSANNDKAAVHEAADEAMKEDSSFSFVKEYFPEVMHGDMWCGVYVMRYQRNDK